VLIMGAGVGGLCLAQDRRLAPGAARAGRGGRPRRRVPHRGAHLGTVRPLVHLPGDAAGRRGARDDPGETGLLDAVAAYEEDMVGYGFDTVRFSLDQAARLFPRIDPVDELV
jgi:hypothetical protein